MMRKTAAVFLVILFAAANSRADTLLDYGGSLLPEWKFQVKYREKYFEYNVYYTYYNLFDTNYVSDDSYEGSLLKGMRHDFILRLGLPKNFTVNADFLYIYQKLDEFNNYNNLHNVSVYAEKYFRENFGVLGGLTVPFDYKMSDDIRLIDSRNELNVLAGVFYREEGGFFNYSGGAVFDKELTFSRNYKGGVSINCSAGIKPYESEGQSIDILLETIYRSKQYDDRKETTAYLAPQVRVNFYNDFYLDLGIEILLYAESVFLNKFFVDGDNKIFYLAEVTYVINSDKRAKEEKPAEEEGFRTWREQDIDREMIPSFWLEEEKKPEEGDDKRNSGESSE